ncbi:hypothetical protein IW150_005210 [Coemansia sp. RSA 2607]|nr:hypothetical protein IW150_005210 [Coemansia sp. RSA 2607]
MMAYTMVGHISKVTSASGALCTKCLGPTSRISHLLKWKNKNGDVQNVLRHEAMGSLNKNCKSPLDKILIQVAACLYNVPVAWEWLQRTQSVEASWKQSKPTYVGFLHWLGSPHPSNKLGINLYPIAAAFIENFN